MQVTAALTKSRERFTVRFRRRALLADAHLRMWPNLLVWAVLMGFSFWQRVGETTFDTKFDLAVRPGDFLDRTLFAWNPTSSLGEMQNQAYGYLFPQGTFFVLGDALGVPDWVVQRLWSGLLLIVAYEGARLLFKAIDQPRVRPWLPMLAGLAFAFSPRLLGLSGVLSGEIHPTAVLPWVVLPLVLVLRGELSALHGAAWSGIGVAAMGGVNATEVLCTLPLPGFLILFSMRHKVGRRLALWWSLAVVMGSLWWVTALLTQGRYSPPFLDYIETGASTTHPLGWANVTRGADHWLSFIWVGGRPWWPGSYELATDPWLVALSGVVAGISLLGLFHRNMPMRVPFAVSALTGMVLLTLGNIVEFGSPLSPGFQALLDGVLSPFRNIHKLDPIVRLPLALGFAHAVGMLAARLTARVTAWERVRIPRAWVRPALVVSAVCLLAASAQPLFTQNLRAPGWKEVPNAWVEAASYLERHSTGGRALVLPGSGFGQQTWGWTIDEPMQALAKSPWVARSQVPLIPGQTIRYLDAIEERIQDGQGSPYLADALARAGISHILVRRDLDLWASEAPSPARVDLAISRSPGFTKVASFGTTNFGSQSMIDIFEVDRNVPLLEAVDLSSVRTLAGGPEDTVTAMEAGLLLPGEVTVNASEPGWDLPPDVVGDGFRRRERQFGRLVDSVSQVMANDEDYRTRRAVHDYPGVSEADRVYAEYTTLKAITASSSSGYVDSLGAIQPQMGPYAAVDGRTETYWRSAPLEDPVGQWLEMSFVEPQVLTGMRLVLGVDGVSGVPVRKVQIDVGNETFQAAVDPGTGEVILPLDGSPVDRVRITVTDTYGDPEFGVVAVRDVAFEGVEIDRTLVLPDSGADGNAAFVFRARPHRRPCVDVGLGPQCDVASGRTSEEEQGLNRTFTIATGGDFVVRAQVVARTSPETADLLHPLPGKIQATASSTTAWDPSVAAQRAVDDNPLTPWLAAQGDPSPKLVLEWDEARTISQLKLDPAHVASSLPDRAVIESGTQRRIVDLGPDSLGYFEPLTTERVRITFPMPETGTTGEALDPLGIGELYLEGIDDLKATWNPESPTGAVCGYGPDVVLDGRRYATRVTGTLAEVAGGTPMRLGLCGRKRVRLDDGTHQLRVTSTAQFAVTAFTLDPETVEQQAEEERGREVSVESWGKTERVVQVGSGPEGVLRIPENVNEAWVATLDGEELEPLRLDSWQQGFMLPAGDGGEVRLEFVPDRSYRTQLFVGAISALILLATAVLLQVAPRRGGRRVAHRQRVRLPRWLLPMWPITVALLLVVAYVLGGVVLSVGVLAGFALRRRRTAILLLPSALVVVASVAQAISAWQGNGIAVTWADWLAGAAVGMFLFALVRPGREQEHD